MNILVFSFVSAICFSHHVGSEKPKLIPHAKTIEVLEKENHGLFCNIASGSPPFTFQWLKNNQPLRSTTDRVKIDVTETFSVLTLKNLSEADSATYTCKVNNVHASESSSTQLIVKGDNFVCVDMKTSKLLFHAAKHGGAA